MLFPSKSKIIAFFVTLIAILGGLLSRSRAQLTKVRVVGKERQKAARTAADTAKRETDREVENVKKKADSGDLSSLNDD